MFRIDGPGATQDNKFTDGDPANGTRATVVTDEWLNSVQEEISKAIEDDGYELDKADLGQLSKLIRRRPIYIGSVGELESLSLAEGMIVYLTQDGMAGEFVVRSGTAPSDPENGRYIVLANGNYAERTETFAVYAEQYGQTTDEYGTAADAFFGKAQAAAKPVAVIDNASEKVTLQNKRTTPLFSAEQVKSNVGSDSFTFISGGAAALQVVRVSCFVDGSKDLKFIIDGEFSTDLQTSSSSTDFYVVAASASDLDRSTSSIKTVTVTYEAGKIVISVAAVDLDQAAFALDIRLNSTAAASERATIRSIKAYQGAALVGDSLYSLVRPSSQWSSGTRQTTFAAECSSYHEIDLAVSAVESSGVVNVSPMGGYSYLKAPYSLAFYEDTIRNDTVGGLVLPRVVSFQPGEYRPYRREIVLTHSRDISLVSFADGAKIACSTRIAESDFTLGGTSGGVTYYTASYDPDAHYSSAVRGGTAQPKLGIELIDAFQESAGKYDLSEETSAANVQTNANTYFFDSGTNTLYVSYPDTFTSFPTAVHIAESASFIRTETTSHNLFGFNIHVSGCEENNWDIRPDNYVRYPVDSSAKYVGLYNCSGLSSATANGLRIDNLDHELVDCKFNYNANDGYNLHFGGLSIIKGGECQGNKEDGMSHHGQQKGYVEAVEGKYNGAGNFTPAFGADVYHYNCLSVAGRDSSNTKTYSGALSALASEAQGDVIAVYDSCRSDLSVSGASAPRHYVGVAFGAAAVAEIYIINPATSGGYQILDKYDTGVVRFDVK